MELTYQSPMMPASYTTISVEEMTYIEGGSITIGSVTVTVHPEVLVDYAINFTFNFINVMGRVAFSSAVNGMKDMHDHGLTISQSIDHYWSHQTPAGKVGTVVVGVFAGFYAFQKAMQIYNTVKTIYTDIKNAYELSKAQKEAQTQEVGLPDPILAAAA